MKFIDTRKLSQEEEEIYSELRAIKGRYLAEAQPLYDRLTQIIAITPTQFVMVAEPGDKLPSFIITDDGTRIDRQ